MTDDWTFIVYSGSHRLKENELVNPQSRIIFKFSSDSSYFIVWHGRLVHGGAKSITGPDGKVLKSSRMFSYLRVPEHNAKFNGNQRRSTRLKNYEIKLKDDTVDRNSFSIMKGPLSDNIIHLPNNKDNLSRKYSTIEPVLGNMNLDGWEIYDGINFHDNKLKKHSMDLNKLLTEKKKDWKGISSSQRKIYVLHTLECYESGLMQKMKSLYTAFDFLLLKKLRKVPYLEEVEMYYKAMLANFSPIDDQVPHRDFWSVKK